mmetsp:Transcript_29898/g.79579  ORF Transcript_29898/g.79579 Transcript_29898/m.79579 type:complete len:254 (+) Transcript_29898:599-1360(+)
MNDENRNEDGGTWIHLFGNFIADQIMFAGEVGEGHDGDDGGRRYEVVELVVGQRHQHLGIGPRYCDLDTEEPQTELVQRTGSKEETRMDDLPCLKKRIFHLGGLVNPPCRFVTHIPVINRLHGHILMELWIWSWSCKKSHLHRRPTGLRVVEVFNTLYKPVAHGKSGVHESRHSFLPTRFWIAKYRLNVVQKICKHGRRHERAEHRHANGFEPHLSCWVGLDIQVGHAVTSVEGDRIGHEITCRVQGGRLHHS